MVKQPSLRIGGLLFWLAAVWLVVGLTAAEDPAEDPDPNNKVRAEGRIEMGIDSLERKYFRPMFRFDFPFRWLDIFTEVMYHQRADGRISGEIDYWLNLGVRRRFGDHIWAEARLNHMCRHISSRINPKIFDLNELLARFWLDRPNIKLGVGFGGYLDGSVDYSSLMVLNAELPGILDSDISVRLEIKWRDFVEILHEAELSFALSRSTDLFVRHTRDYDYPPTAYIGMRLKSQGKLADQLDSLKLTTAWYPRNERHKMLAEGEFRLAFWKTDLRRVVLTIGFDAPILRESDVPGAFYPEYMVYPITLEYERRLGKGWRILWYGRYHLHLPLDVDEPFQADLGTGLGVRNGYDFDRLDRPIRFEAYGGYNFKLDYDLGLRFGFSMFRIGSAGVHSEIRLRLNSLLFRTSLRLFADFGRRVSVRPFLRFDKTEYVGEPPSEVRVLLGVGLFRWYGE